MNSISYAEGTYETDIPFTNLPHPEVRSGFDTSFTVAADYIIFTDGSKNAEGTGSAFVVFANEEEIYQNSDTLHPNCSIFQAELCAIYMAVQWCEANLTGSRVTICSDSASAINALRNLNNLHPLVRKILNYIPCAQNSYSLEWVRGHQGVLGNERADLLAREAATIGTSGPFNYSVLPASFLKLQHWNYSLDLWQQRWDSYNGLARNFFPSIHDHLSNHWVSPDYETTQFFTGHGRFRAYLQRFGKSTTDICTICNCRDGVEHYVYMCPMTEDARHELALALSHRGINWPCELHVLLKDSDTYKAFKKLIHMYHIRSVIH
ncbi:uncharacterized protein LOC111629790 [Centruroides sculpturatus]|uniref:uncharacterized protein LOC111629790 n=1 Tax=Centruroides sculpturatus TaxID=218467 RepID=UPI000C6D2632|nr:uncharacterized protein LOC111629790 [Centruroides sculpturatus]